MDAKQNGLEAWDCLFFLRSNIGTVGFGEIWARKYEKHSVEKKKRPKIIRMQEEKQNYIYINKPSKAFRSQAIKQGAKWGQRCVFRR